MLELAANLSTLFTEWPLPERPARAAACGFRSVEMRSLEGHAASDIADALSAAGVSCALINADSGDLQKGDLGFAINPDDEGRFVQSLWEALDSAEALGAPLVHVMAGRLSDGRSAEEQRDTALARYHDASQRARDRGVTLVIEPLAHSLVPDYLFTDFDFAASFVEAIGNPCLGLLFDVFHLQLCGGNILARFEKHSSLVHHVQIAAVPGRGEPNAGELDTYFVLQGIEALGYRGRVGCEYNPRSGTMEGLGWAAPWGIRPVEGTS